MNDSWFESYNFSREINLLSEIHATRNFYVKPLFHSFVTIVKKCLFYLFEVDPSGKIKSCGQP